MKRSPMPQRSAPMARGGGLERTGPPKRKGGPIPFRSAKVDDRRSEREAAVLEASERDGGCVLGLMALQVGVPDHWPFCSGPGSEGHEVDTRGRGGSAYDVENIATLCRSCHAWVTEHTLAAEALGLILPSWAASAHADEARRLRNRYQRVPFSMPTIPGPGSDYLVPPPSWRARDDAWQHIARRDLESLWGVF